MLIVNTLSFLSAIEAFSRFQSSGTFLLYLQEHLSNNLLCYDHVVWGLLSPHFFKILFPDQDDHYRHLFTCFWSRYSASSFSSVTALLGSAAIPAVILILIVIMALARWSWWSWWSWSRRAHYNATRTWYPSPSPGDWLRAEKLRPAGGSKSSLGGECGACDLFSSLWLFWWFVR